MFLENIYLAGYAIAWITLTALYIIRTKGVGLGGMLLITYSLSALMSIVFFGGMGAFLTEGADISWQPLLYLFLTINICFLYLDILKICVVFHLEIMEKVLDS